MAMTMTAGVTATVTIAMRVTATTVTIAMTATTADAMIAIAATIAEHPPCCPYWLPPFY